jgi:hypothetical protein
MNITRTNDTKSINRKGGQKYMNYDATVYKKFVLHSVHNHRTLYKSVNSH